MISIELKPSLTLACLLAAAHIGSIFLIMALHVSYLLVMLLFFSMTYSIMQYALLSFSGSLVSLAIGEKSCLYSLGDGRQKSFVFLKSTYVSPYLTVLNMKEEGSFFAKSAVILPDSVDPEPFRQLRVWLKWKSHIIFQLPSA